MRAAHYALLIAIAATAPACSGDGSGSNESGVAYSGSQLSDYAAGWDGYAEAWQFASGSDRVRIALDASGQGTIEFGDQPLLAPPSAPDVGYPPGLDMFFSGSLGAREGFLYPIYGAYVEGLRIRFGVDPNDIVRAWCQMQTPVLDEFNTDQPLYACVPNWGYEQSDTCSLINPQTNEKVPVDCTKLALCQPGGACQCTASGCDAYSFDGHYPIQLDAALEGNGNNLVGTLVLDSATRITVRLTRL
jgi:hypothetical protein